MDHEGSDRQGTSHEDERGRQWLRERLDPVLSPRLRHALDRVGHADEPGGPVGLHASPLWRRRRERDLSRERIRRGPGYLYRAGEVLVSHRDVGRAARDLGRLRAEPDARNGSLDPRLPVLRFRVDDSADIPAEVAAARGRARDEHEPPLQISANQVLSGEPFYEGGPGSLPRPARPATIRPFTVGEKSRPRLAVLDTGVPERIAALHAELDQRLFKAAAFIDHLDADDDDDDLLDAEAGHGTFICGLIERIAPELAVQVQQVLSPAGFCDDVQLAEAILAADTDVLNLSLGGYTDGDVAPPVVAAALRALPADVVVVAAAGNHGSDRPFWPAAFKRVVSVGAVDTRGPRETWTPAAFSNHGWWVDCCAPGVDLHSTYVEGQRLIEDNPEPTAFQGWATWSGTSFAAPLVAARIAEGVIDGRSAVVAAAELLSSLQPLPGHAELGGFFDPGIDLSER